MVEEGEECPSRRAQPPREITTTMTTDESDKSETPRKRILGMQRPVFVLAITNFLLVLALIAMGILLR